MMKFELTAATVKSVAYRAFEAAAECPRTNEEVAELCRHLVPGSAATARSIASMKVDWRKALGAAAPAPAAERGGVRALVEAMLEAGGMTHAQIAEAVRTQVPGASTTAKSVASTAVAWRRSRPTPAAVEMTAEHLGL